MQRTAWLRVCVTDWAHGATTARCVAFAVVVSVKRPCSSCTGSPTQALALLRHLAESGHARAMRDLSVFFLHGRGGVAQDLQLSHSWLLKAARAGNRRAQYEIALYFQYGVGCESVDLAKASEFYELGERR